VKEREEFERCATKLKALAEPNRLRIVNILLAGEATVSAISEAISQPITMTSHHLGIMLKAGLVQCRRQGRFVCYSLHPDVLRLNDGKPLEQINLGCCVVNFEPGGSVVLTGDGSAHAD
jgi:ArsR family transcriptional regulator, nickel/cobalt-responsive transcriptional repressor